MVAETCSLSYNVNSTASAVRVIAGHQKQTAFQTNRRSRLERHVDRFSDTPAPKIRLSHTTSGDPRTASSIYRQSRPGIDGSTPTHQATGILP